MFVYKLIHAFGTPTDPAQMKVLQVRKQLKQRNLPHTDDDSCIKDLLVDAMVKSAGLGKHASNSAPAEKAANNVCDDKEKIFWKNITFSAEYHFKILLQSC